MAAKDTGLLQEAKNKLEKEVEDLISRLQREKHLKADLEETSTRERAKLQQALEELQTQYKEMQIQAEEAKAQQVKDLEEINTQEKAKLQQALEVLQTQVEEMQIQLQETKAQQVKESDLEETNTQDKAKLQQALEELQTQHKEMQIEVEETKAQLAKEHDFVETNIQEKEKLQKDLEELQTQYKEMQIQVEETKAELVKEREAAKKVVLDMPVVQEAPILDHDMLNKITAENEELKSQVNSLENKISETVEKYEETSKISEERLKQAQEAESKLVELKTSIQRVEGKIVNMESEDGNLRRRALANSSKGKLSGYLSTEDGDASKDGQNPPPGRFFGSESMRRSQADRQRASFNTLIRCVSLNVGFSQGKPVAAFTIYKCLLHWKCFEAVKTGVFDRLIQLVGCAFEKDDIDHLSYWLSNSSALLFLLQKSLKGKVGGSAEEDKPVGFFTKMAQALSSSNLPVDVVRTVEAKYPALLFRQQLSAYVETMYGLIRENLRNQLSPLISSCIQVPGETKESTQNEQTAAPASQWQSIIGVLKSFLDIMKKNFVPPLLVQKLLSQTFSFINAQLFNSLLQNRECCTFTNGECIKSGLDDLLALIEEETEEYVGSASDELKHVRQAAGFMVIHQKTRITYEDLTTDLCPALSIQQLYRMCTLCGDDDFNTSTISPKVISAMKEAMKDVGTDAVSDDAATSYLLNDHNSIPFSIDDINNSMQVRDFMGMSHPPMLIEDQGFQFLLE